MKRRLLALLWVTTLLFGGCAAKSSARPAASGGRSFTYADNDEGLRRHCSQILAQLRRLEKLERRKQPEKAKSAHSIRRELRPRLEVYFEMILSDKTVRSARFGESGPNRKMYHLQHELLECMSDQLLHLQEVIEQIPDKS